MNEQYLAEWLGWMWWVAAGGVAAGLLLHWARASGKEEGGVRCPPAAPSGTVEESLLVAGRFARTFTLGNLGPKPKRRLAVVACMDCRLPVEQVLGLKPGEAHVLRNAGGIVTEDVVRSLLLSHHMMGIREVVVVQHTDCGLSHCREEELLQHLETTTGRVSPLPVRFHPFRDLEDSVRTQLRRIRAHPWLGPTLKVRGFVYDVSRGTLKEVVSEGSVSEGGLPVRKP